MTLAETVNALADLDENGTIYAAEPWAESSQSVVTLEPASGGLPDEAEALGLKYFLEVGVAREVLQGWLESLGMKPTIRAKVERLIQYAMNDA